MNTHSLHDLRGNGGVTGMSYAQVKETRNAEFEAFMKEFSPYDAQSTSEPVFDSPALKTLMDCWRDSAPKGGLPSASELNLAKLAPWMPDMTKMSVEGARDIRYRLAGTRACERLGMDPTGINLYELMDPSIRDVIVRSFHEVCLRPCGFHARYQNVNTTGRHSTVQSLYLPLRPLPDGTPGVIGIHTPGEMIEYGDPAPYASIATTITGFTWIDLGFGAPY
jgi:hypothetical protein